MKEMGYGFYTERDWRLFSRKVDQWVERYYRIKNENYRRILDGKSLDSKKWWNLHKQMKKDIHFLDEAIEMSRSHLGKH